MCGAFSIIHPFRDLSGKFNAGYNERETDPRYNVRPSQPIPTILNTDPEEIIYTMWGIRPSYDKTGKVFLINARDDSLQKFTWKGMLESQRCLIIADGFYEWLKSPDKKTRTPYRFELQDKEPFAFAGLWHMEKTPEGQEVPHSVIITTEPNEVVKSVHDRMPAIFDPEESKEWLNPDRTAEDALKLIKPYPAQRMVSYVVSPLVNKATNDFEEIIKPVQNSA